MSNPSKAKGYRGEIEVMRLLQVIVNDEYQRINLHPPELTRSPAGRDIRGLPWIAVEVKYRETPCLDQWWIQTKVNAMENQEPVLIWRSNHQPWRVRMFGRLKVSDGTLVRAPVDITVDAFSTWFRLMVRATLPMIAIAV